MKKMTTAHRVRELLTYHPETGAFYWRAAPDRRADYASPAMRYFCLRIDGEIYIASRIAWLWVTGEWPQDQIDHINRNGRDNRWANLREATQSQQEGNKRRRSDNKSGFRGVSIDKRDGKWTAFIRRPKGGNRYLGRFSTAEEASAAYEAAAAEQFKEFLAPPDSRESEAA